MEEQGGGEDVSGLFARLKGPPSSFAYQFLPFCSTSEEERILLLLLSPLRFQADTQTREEGEKRNKHEGEQRGMNGKASFETFRETKKGGMVYFASRFVVLCRTLREGRGGFSNLTSFQGIGIFRWANVNPLSSSSSQARKFIFGTFLTLCGIFGGFFSFRLLPAH